MKNLDGFIRIITFNLHENIFSFKGNRKRKGVDMISGGPAAIPKIYRSAESQDFPINPVKTQNKSFQTYKVENKSRLRN